LNVYDGREAMTGLPLFDDAPSFDRDRLAGKLRVPAAVSVFIGSSSCKYPCCPNYPAGAIGRVVNTGLLLLNFPPPSTRFPSEPVHVLFNSSQLQQ
jgi:hypothetical protein